MIFARSMAVACLTVMTALCWLTGGLLVVLAFVQSMQGEPEARPLLLLAAAAVFGALALGSGWIRTRFEAAGT
ncbi:MAG: hypothetical protein NT037_12780 [Hyphomicrobiales bacterium]|jgi:hypothetical protein|nr:hypothetical protein [Hyphomicrobiales bacterium]